MERCVGDCHIQSYALNVLDLVELRVVVRHHVLLDERDDLLIRLALVLDANLGRLLPRPDPVQGTDEEADEQCDRHVVEALEQERQDMGLVIGWFPDR